MERNTRMLLAYPHAHVIAFPLGGPGTRHCIAEARRLGMRVSVHRSAAQLREAAPPPTSPSEMFGDDGAVSTGVTR